MSHLRWHVFMACITSFFLGMTISIGVVLRSPYALVPMMGLLVTLAAWLSSRPSSSERAE
jgi:hypothetical protein